MNKEGKELRNHIDDMVCAKKKGIDFRHPSPELMKEGLSRGIDLSNESVVRMLEHLQQSQPKNGKFNFESAMRSYEEDQRKNIEGMVASMGRKELGMMLQSLNVSCDFFTSSKERRRLLVVTILSGKKPHRPFLYTKKLQKFIVPFISALLMLIIRGFKRRNFVPFIPQNA
mmetsp:Transcript_9925/g.14738  ORF Transcript_9925/g.14738 Transcript_9925/m.14738 type:complete len:171 (+) Transcript_9925:315-827(+)